MKKLFTTLTAVLLIAIMSITLSACNNNGKSAYELAVENGFSGTITEWLESLKGQDGSLRGKVFPLMKWRSLTALRERKKNGLKR